MDEQAFKETVAGNIAAYRKALSLTQLELAEKLNYSDKAVSKWERAEALPDTFVLKQIAQLFGIGLDDLTRNHGNKKIRRPHKFFQKKIIIPMLSVGLVWLIATNVFAILLMVGVQRAWLAFYCAIPATLVVCLVFSALWWTPLLSALCISGIIWTVAGLLYLCVPVNYNYMFFIIAVPLQVLEILWTIFKNPLKKIKSPPKLPPPSSEN
ncbi:MAG: helix-turn-helix transcriptional regulator [Firmicutes bacterium]|nr:helix-turn-helix transcriptional regulator [Bacillota bacterium]